METVTVSPKSQVVIPQTVRESLGIRPGQQVQVIQYENRIELVPLKPMRKTRGFSRVSIQRSSARQIAYECCRLLWLA
jgi:AbrB family looped-hinge helix DNA binding protein